MFRGYEMKILIWKLSFFFLFSLLLTCSRNTWDEYTFMYVVNSGDNTVSCFHIDPYGTELSTKIITLTGTTTGQVRIHPKKRFIYFQLSGSYAVYKTNKYGDLSNGTVYSNPNSVPPFVDDMDCFHPNGRWQVHSVDSDNINISHVDQDTGEIIAPANTSLTFWPQALFSRNGNFLYSFHVSSDGYRVNRFNDDGTLAQTASSGWSGSAPELRKKLVIDLSGKFIYGMNALNQGVISFVPVINNGTDLDPANGVAYSTDGTTSNELLMHPDGKFLYALVGNSIYWFTIDQSTGHLTSSGSISNGVTAFSGAFHPDGEWLYVTYQGSNKVSVYNVDTSTGSLTWDRDIAVGNTPQGIAIGRVSHR